MAYGISSMYILLGLKKLKKDDIKLDSIDPFQETQWNNFGVKLIKKIKMEKYHKLYEDKSYIVLPKSSTLSKTIPCCFCIQFNLAK